MTTPDSPLDQLMDGSETELPQFATVMRGYDRGQVDDYVARLNDFLADAEARAQRAERSVADVIRRNERLTDELRQAIERGQHERAGAPYEGLGERIDHILRLAGEEADGIRQQARSEADEIVAEAQRRRETERESAERELAAVAARRESVVGELRRVQEALSTLGLRQALDEALPGETVTAVAAADPPAPDGAELNDPDATRVIQLPSAANQT
ncbi:MAG TPA: DivIVA domain-containing protein [Mycobacteriales bacterium]|jgi:DivIVA domain-containing protein|nr:DivIVA domain-containing protein [Mycobacteriales bacterium]